ncbi:MAG: DUF4290 domain-containing protein [Bacteroidales bacterium]|nr:DUF4290 domain-containing protein [Bacteroidales bacterium]
MIDTLEYNSARKRLFIPEYGRNIQKMVEYCITIPNRELRTKTAEVIVEVMAIVRGYSIENNVETLHKLWDHLFIISDFKLDVDFPFPKPEPKSLNYHPSKPAYNTDEPNGYRNYGKNIKYLIQAVCTIKDEKERQKMAILLANHIKKSNLTWNKDIIPDEIIIEQIYKFSHGKLNLPLDTILMDSQNVYALNNRVDNSKKQRLPSPPSNKNAPKKKRKKSK